MIIFPGAASPSEVDAFERAISKAFDEGSETVLCQRPREQIKQPISKATERRNLRVVDAFAVLPEALNLLGNKRVVNFLRVIFGEGSLVFQSLSFDRGSEQGLHQDTAYVVVDRPMELAACWIALKDIPEGSGELMYVRGSHRFPEADYFNGKKHWNPEQDGDEAHGKWFRWLEESQNKIGLKREVIRAKKGGILIWHADLAHGGSPINDLSKTRKSLVGHYCPAPAHPHSFSFRPDRQTIRQHGDLRYSSMHYDLAAMPEPTPKSRGLVDRLKALVGR